MKNIVLAALFCLCCTAAQAQDQPAENTGFQKERMFVGGNFGLVLGRFTLINLAPQVGYRFNRFFAAGLGLNLTYASERTRDVYGQEFSKTTQWITGLNTFARFYPTQRFMLQVQPEANYRFGKVQYFQPNEWTSNLDAAIVPSLLMGGGLVMPTERGAFLTTVLYDVLQNPSSPYGNRPIVSVGFNVNL